MPKRDNWWCDPCQQASFTSTGKCILCGGPAVRLTREYAEKRLQELAYMRARRDSREVGGPGTCDVCGGLGSERQRFLSSNGVREKGIGQLAGQPRNLTGTTVEVLACECMADHPEKVRNQMRREAAERRRKQRAAAFDLRLNRR